MSFYNTIKLEGVKLQKEIANTLKQEELIQSIFEANAGREISPSQILQIVQKHYNLSWPLTSARRAITDLTSKDILEKTDTMVDGLYGKPEHCWKLKEKKDATLIWFNEYLEGKHDEKQIVQAKLFIED